MDSMNLLDPDRAPPDAVRAQHEYFFTGGRVGDLVGLTLEEQERWGIKRVTLEDIAEGRVEASPEARAEAPRLLSPPA
jgi:hypothetical protein